MSTYFHRFRQRSTRLLFTPQRPLRRLAGGLIVGLIVGIVLWSGLYNEAFNSIRIRLRDTLYLQPRPPKGIVTIVAIDDASLASYGRSVTDWPRSIHADLVRFLDEAGARVIVFDVLFSEPSEDDADLADATRKARNVIYPLVGDEANRREVPVTGAGQLVTYDLFLHTVPEIEEAAAGTGHANIIPDDDGFARQVPLMITEGDRLVPALSFAAYIEYLHQSPDWVEVDKNVIRFANRNLHTDDHGQMLISFFGPPSHPDASGTFAVYSVVDILEGRVPPEVFNDQIVLIGVLDATALPDSYPTPNTLQGEQMFGVEIHANVIETIHQSLPSVVGTSMTPFPFREQPYTEQVAVTFAIALGAGLLFPFLRWYVGLFVMVLLYLLYLTWAGLSMYIWGRLLELLFPAMALGFTFMGTMIVSYVFEERRRSQISDLFSRYVSPEIAQKIVDEFDHGRLELGGEEREITVLFADVRGFTSLSEGLQPTEVVSLLNVFLEEMSSIVMRHGGAINKYIGDNIMAFWNAPYPQPDHASQAVQAGLEMLEAIQRLNQSHQFPSPVQFGIGINTGPVVVGNIGSRKRLEYTPIGDTVNVASRLCNVAPGGSCFVGSRTYTLVQRQEELVEIHHLKLKGKHDAVEIYELRPTSAPRPEPLPEDIREA